MGQLLSPGTQASPQFYPSIKDCTISALHANDIATQAFCRIDVMQCDGGSLISMSVSRVISA
jgi:hypothetical protein